MRSVAALALLGSSALVAAAPSNKVTKSTKSSATTCTFTSAASASASKTSCTNIVLSGITVPAGKTLDLTGLTSGTTVTVSFMTLVFAALWTVH